MYREKNVNVPLLLFSLAGYIAAFVLNELLFTFLSPMPYAVQAGLYMTFAALICGAAILASETAASGGYVWQWREKFAKDSLRAWLLFLPIAFLVGLATQFLYGFAGVRIFDQTIEFQGTYLICDISGSMRQNDPSRSAVEAMCAYIDEIPDGEYVGVALYNEEVDVLRRYKRLEADDERGALKEAIKEKAVYEGGTDTHSALMEAIGDIRAVPGDHPGMILLFSDGLCDINFNAIQRAARGDSAAAEIPVNTVYYASAPFGGYQLSNVSKVTGGVFNYLDTAHTAEGAFSKSRASYAVEKIFLLGLAYGSKRNSPVRIFLQALFIAVWCVALGILAVAMLDNRNLIRDFLYFRIITSILTGVAYAILMVYTPYGGVPLVRLIPALGMVTLIMPTYRLHSGGRTAT